MPQVNWAHLLELFWCSSIVSVFWVLLYIGYIILQLSDSCREMDCQTPVESLVRIVSSISLPAFLLITQFQPWRFPSVSWFFNFYLYYSLGWISLFGTVIPPPDDDWLSAFMQKVGFFSIPVCIIWSCCDYCLMEQPKENENKSSIDMEKAVLAEQEQF